MGNTPKVLDEPIKKIIVQSNGLVCNKEIDRRDRDDVVTAYNNLLAELTALYNANNNTIDMDQKCNKNQNLVTKTTALVGRACPRAASHKSTIQQDLVQLICSDIKKW